MEQLIIFILFVLGSIVSAILQKKKEQAERQTRRDSRTEPQPRRMTSAPPVPHWPKTTRDWQTELKRLLEPEAPPPASPVLSPPEPVSPRRPAPLARPPSSTPPSLPSTTSVLTETVLAAPAPFILPSRLPQSAAAYSRGAHLDEAAAARLRRVEKQTEAARPAPLAERKASPLAAVVRQWSRNPQSMQGAFVASLIFAEPRAFD